MLCVKNSIRNFYLFIFKTIKGSFSTPLLHRVALDIKRQVVSIDTKMDWVKKFSFYNLTSNHKVFFMDMNQLDNYGLEQKWGLVLVDHGVAGTRYMNINKFAQLANFVIAHDAEISSDHMYKYEQMEVRDNFKYACKYSIYGSKDSYTSTLILSNFFNVSKLTTIFDQIKTDYGHVSCDLNF